MGADRLAGLRAAAIAGLERFDTWCASLPPETRPMLPAIGTVRSRFDAGEALQPSDLRHDAELVARAVAIAAEANLDSHGHRSRLSAAWPDRTGEAISDSLGEVARRAETRIDVVAAVAAALAEAAPATELVLEGKYSAVIGATAGDQTPNPLELVARAELMNQVGDVAVQALSEIMEILNDVLTRLGQLLESAPHVSHEAADAAVLQQHSSPGVLSSVADVSPTSASAAVPDNVSGSGAGISTAHHLWSHDPVGPQQNADSGGNDEPVTAPQTQTHSQAAAATDPGAAGSSGPSTVTSPTDVSMHVDSGGPLNLSDVNMSVGVHPQASDLGEPLQPPHDGLNGASHGGGDSSDVPPSPDYSADQVADQARAQAFTAPVAPIAPSSAGTGVVGPSGSAPGTGIDDSPNSDALNSDSPNSDALNTDSPNSDISTGGPSDSGRIDPMSDGGSVTEDIAVAPGPGDGPAPTGSAAGGDGGTGGGDPGDSGGDVEVDAVTLATVGDR